MPTDVSTAVLLDHERRPHRDSAAILKMLLYLQRPYNWFGRLGLLVPKSARDWGYQTFARNRGAIWKRVKKITGKGETMMHPYKHKILGIPRDATVPSSWGFHNDFDDSGRGDDEAEIV